MIIYSTDLFGNRSTPTTTEDVVRLGTEARITRLSALIVDSIRIYEEAIKTHLGNHRLVAKVVLFSGGNDSTVLAHLFRNFADYAAHANTTIGIEETREFVRDCCTKWKLPLLERTAPTSFRELVLERGFPGPAMHYKMYQRLKERPLEQVRRELVVNPRQDRVVFLAGRRRSESERRKSIPLHERRGSVIWVSPLAMWTKLDLNLYRKLFAVPRNPVSDALHMSGECLCGAFAHPGELEELEFWFPTMAQEIRDLETEVRAAGHGEPFCQWGHMKGSSEPPKYGPMCDSCELFSMEAAK